MKQNIAVISEHASPLAEPGGTDSGGQNIYVAQVARHLAQRGYRLDIFTRRDNPHLPAVIQWLPDVRVIHIDAGPPGPVRKEELLPLMDDFTSNILRFCTSRRVPYDLIHAHFWMSGLVAARIKQTLGTPFVITFHALGKVRRLHQGAADQFPTIREQLEQQVMHEANTIIAECPQDYADLVNLYHVDRDRIRIIPCGFDQNEFEPLPQEMAREMIGLDQDEWTVLQLGRMVPRKGIDTVVQGFARFVAARGARARLLMVGGDSEHPDPQRTPEIGRLQELAQAEGIAEQVTFTGKRGRDVLKYYYNAADVFVTLPWYEPFGITPLEAMACATPVIGARVGGIQYTVRHGETGYLIPPRNPAALASYLLRLYDEPATLQRLGQQALLRVRHDFTWQHVAAAIADLYESIINSSTIRIPNGNHTVRYPFSHGQPLVSAE
ncbi:MAG: glycosyltransferase family 1 protein [Chloroflexaceae bacterium]|nr:glycosyltransferase family 1 protein [Chloroflexaceae bacterium]